MASSSSSSSPLLLDLPPPPHLNPNPNPEMNMHMNLMEQQQGAPPHNQHLQQQWHYPPPILQSRLHLHPLGDPLHVASPPAVTSSSSCSLISDHHSCSMQQLIHGAPAFGNFQSSSSSSSLCWSAAADSRLYHPQQRGQQAPGAANSVNSSANSSSITNNLCSSFSTTADQYGAINNSRNQGQISSFSPNNNVSLSSAPLAMATPAGSPTSAFTCAEVLVEQTPQINIPLMNINHQLPPPPKALIAAGTNNCNWGSSAAAALINHGVNQSSPLANLIASDPAYADRTAARFNSSCSSSHHLQLLNHHHSQLHSLNLQHPLHLIPDCSLSPPVSRPIVNLNANNNSNNNKQPLRRASSSKSLIRSASVPDHAALAAAEDASNPSIADQRQLAVDPGVVVNKTQQPTAIASSPASKKRRSAPAIKDQCEGKRSKVQLGDESTSNSSAEGTPNVPTASSEVPEPQKSGQPSPAKEAEPPKPDYIHVRARRGQATDSHSLAERVRREKISERMKYLQDLVPGCSKVTGKAMMLDEIINYVQSLQRQVEFLSLKLASVHPSKLEFNVETLFSAKEQQVRFAGQADSLIGGLYPFHLHHHLDNLQQHMHAAHQIAPPSGLDPRAFAAGSECVSQINEHWDDADLQNIVQMSFPHHPLIPNCNGPLYHGHMKREL